MAHRSLPGWILSTVMAAGLVAQQPDRDRGFGMVRDKAGKPWVGATVHLVHITHPGILDQDYIDRIHCTTDARGRFSAQLLVGARYVAWATQPDGETRYRATAAARGVVARVPAILEETFRPFRRRVTLVGEAKGLQWVASARVGSQLLYHPLTPDAKGAANLPGWPTDTVAVTAWLEGWQAFTKYVYTTEARLDAKLLAEPEVIQLPKLQSEALVALDAATGKPIAGARVAREAKWPTFGEVRVTDAQGRVPFLHTTVEGGRRPSIRATLLADGYAETSLRFSSRNPIGPVKAEPGTTVKGVITLGDEPLPNLPILVDASIKTGRGSTWFGIRARMFRTDAAGRVAVPGRIASHAYRITAMLSPVVRARLRGEGAKAPPVAAQAILAAERAGEPKQLGPCRLDRLRRLRIRVRNKDGTPPGSVRVTLLPMVAEQRSMARPYTPLYMYTDRRGQVEVIVGDCEEILLYTATAKGAGWTLASAAAKGAELTLDPRHVVRFRVLTDGDKPLVGYSVGYVGPEQQLGRQQVGRQQDGAAIPQRVVTAIHKLSMSQSFDYKYGQTDAKGLVQLVLPLIDIGFDLSIRGRDRSYGRLVVPVAGDHGGKPIDVAPVMKKR